MGSSPSLIALSVLLLFIGVGLLIYYFFFIRVSPPASNPSPSPSGNTGPIKSNDTLKLFNIGSNQFVSPCGGPSICNGSPLSLRTDSSYNSLNGDAVGLRNFKITGPNPEIKFGDIIKLQSVTTSPVCINCNGSFMYLCDFLHAYIATDITNNSDEWIIHDPGNPTSTAILNYGQSFNLINNGPSNPLLAVCSQQGCNELVPGCGPEVTSSENQSGGNFDWSFTFVNS